MERTPETTLNNSQRADIFRRAALKQTSRHQNRWLCATEEQTLRSIIDELLLDQHHWMSVSQMFFSWNQTGWSGFAVQKVNRRASGLWSAPRLWNNGFRPVSFPLSANTDFRWTHPRCLLTDAGMNVPSESGIARNQIKPWDKKSEQSIFLGTPWSQSFWSKGWIVMRAAGNASY